MVTKIRAASQQLVTPYFDSPKDLVAWMGAIQAQEYAMAKWAIGIRLKSPSLSAVDDALRKGEIIRTHIMRPTWHFVPAQDLRWMLKLSAGRIKAAYKSYMKSRGADLDEAAFSRCNDVLEKILEGHKSLTKQDLAHELNLHGIQTDDYKINAFIARAEVEGILCSGVDDGKKATYALLEERVPPTKELHKEEALALLASRYFKSHSPVQLQDFIWWSGLTTGEAKQAIGLIESDLVTDQFASETFFVHQSWAKIPKVKPALHFLPSFDEYLISYKDRTAVLPLEHHHKAFNKWGIFYPVIFHEGQIIGNWEKSVRKGQTAIKSTYFESDLSIDPGLIRQAEERINSFYLK